MEKDSIFFGKLKVRAWCNQLRK